MGWLDLDPCPDHRSRRALTRTVSAVAPPTFPDRSTSSQMSAPTFIPAPHPIPPSPGTPGEGRGEGSCLPIAKGKSQIANPNAFTLIELLVVIALIALL